MTTIIKPPVINQKPRTQIENSLVSTWAWWNMHQPSGGTLDERTGKTGFDGATIAGEAIGTQWTNNPGWFTPDSTNGNYTVISAANCNSLFALDTLNGVGGIFIKLTLNVGSNPGGGLLEHPFYYGATGAKYTLLTEYAANLNLKMYFHEEGGSVQVSPGVNITAHIGNDIIIGVYVDVTNSKIDMYVDESSVSSTDNFAGDGDLVGTTTSSNLGFGIGNRGDGTPTTMQGTHNSGVKMRDVFAIRFETDKSASIPAIMQGFIDAGGIELPWELEGL